MVDRIRSNYTNLIQDKFYKDNSKSVDLTDTYENADIIEINQDNNIPVTTEQQSTEELQNEERIAEEEQIALRKSQEEEEINRELIRSATETYRQTNDISDEPGINVIA